MVDEKIIEELNENELDKVTGGSGTGIFAYNCPYCSKTFRYTPLMQSAKLAKWAFNYHKSLHEGIVFDDSEYDLTEGDKKQAKLIYGLNTIC